MPTLLTMPDLSLTTDAACCLIPVSTCAPVCLRPLFGQRICAGFPSPAEEYLEKGLDLNTYL